ncbi:MAG TPA: NB-ARC domain-containing protein, partial [Abditibacteriaceae bacterium]
MNSIGEAHSNIEGIDVLILTAVQDERNVVKEIESDWVPRNDSSGYEYHVRQDSGGLRWALARAFDMGPELASNIATRLVTTLKPRCIAMVGVCAGWREKVQLGDVIVAERLFRYDAGKLRAFRRGEVREEEVFHDIRTYNLNPLWRQKTEDFPSLWADSIRFHPRPFGYTPQEHWLLNALDKSEKESSFAPPKHPERKERCPDWTSVVERLEKSGLVVLDSGLRLTELGRRHVANMQDRFPDGIPPERDYPRAYVAPMATGSRVVEDEDLFPTIHNDARKTLGVDMEASAVAAVAEIEQVQHCLIVKGVQDHADSDKDDRFRKYAIEASYRFLTEFLRHNLEPANGGPPFIVPKHDTSSFTGREDELKALERVLLDERGERICTIAGLSGTGGIGKTALAVHFAAIHRSRFPDGVIGVRVDGKQSDAIAREFARNIGEVIEPEDERDAATIMQSLFAGRASLLLFDNAEDASIRQLNPGGRCAVIVTTRDRGLPVLLDVPQQARIDVPPLAETKGIELLQKLIGQRVTDELDATRQIVNLVGALPLALQIVGAVLQMEPWRTLESFAGVLASERERLSRLHIRGDDHLDVRVSFAASLRFLQPEEVDFFACLAVCAADGFGVASAAAAAGCDEATALDRLAYLHRLSLVDSPDGARDTRFVLHPLLRDFSHELSVERELLQSSAERHAHYFIERVKQFSTDNSLSVDSTVADAFISNDLDEALIAAEYMLKHGEIDNEFVHCFQPLLERGGYWRIGADLMRRILISSERGKDATLIMYLKIRHAKFLQLCGEYTKALEALNPVCVMHEDSLPLEPMIEVKWRTTLGGVLQRLGCLEEAADVLKQAARI